MSSQSQNIHTYARIKPLFSNEQKVFFKKDICTIVTKNNDPFSFDKVFDDNCSNEEVYNQTTKSIIQHSLKGFNSCVLAYGQTSSGKTYTMKGSYSNPGIIPLCLRDIFRKCEDQRLALKIIGSYMEIYNEQIIDLLADQDNQIIDIRQDHKKVLVFNGLKEVEIRSIGEAMQFFEKGEQKRKFASNNLNVNSSRSHAIFRISLNLVDDDCNQTCSQINLVDLAGSEGIDRTRGEKISKIEGENINKSLLALTKVIKLMSEKEGQFINFRDSKLTRILQKSLCENTKSSIICMINPTSINHQESMNTLKFGQMAAKIKIEARQNLIRTEQSRKQAHLRNIQFLPSQKMQLQEARNKIKENSDYMIFLNEKIKHLQQDNINKDSKLIFYERKIEEIKFQLVDQNMHNENNRQEWWRQKQMLQNRVDNYREEIQNLDKINNELKSANRTLEKNEKALVETLQHYENQCKSLNTELAYIKNKLDEQNSKISKPSPMREAMRPQRKQKSKLQNPFQIQPYKQDPNRLSTSKLSWIIRLKTEVIDLSRKVNEYTKANCQIAEQNEELRRKIEEYEERISKERSSGKINPEALEYNEIKKLSNKIKSLRIQLKRSQERQRKNRQILKKQSHKNLVEMNQFEEWYEKKYTSNFFLEKQVQTNFGSMTNQQMSSNQRQQLQQITQKNQIQQNSFAISKQNSPCKSQKSPQSHGLIINNNETLIRTENPEQSKIFPFGKINFTLNQQKPIPNENIDLNINEKNISNLHFSQSRDSCGDDLLIDGLSPCFNACENSNRNFVNMDENLRSKRNSKTTTKEKLPLATSKKLKIDETFKSPIFQNKMIPEEQKDIEI